MGASSSSVESWTLLSLGLAVIAVRIYVRWTMVGPRNFQLDDYLMPLAGILFICETVAAYLVGALFGGLTNSYMTDAERESLDPSSVEYASRQAGSKVQIVGWSFYTAILWLIKFSLAIFYARLTLGLSHMALRVKIAYWMLGLTWMTVEFFIVLGCQPMSKNWQIYPDPGNFCQPTISRLNVLPLVILNVLTDMYLLSIPLPMLWKVNIGIKRKITLMLLLSGAVFVMTASIIRACIVLTAGATGAVASAQWACRETFVSIVVSNLPIIQPLIRNACNKVGLSALFSTTGRSQNAYTLSHNALDKSHNRSKKSQNFSAIQSDSDEQELVAKEAGEGTKKITVTSETVVESQIWGNAGMERTSHESKVHPVWRA